MTEEMSLTAPQIDLSERSGRVERVDRALNGVSGIQAGVAVEHLVQVYTATLFRVAYSIVRSPDEAEDVVQEVFVRVVEHRSKLPEVREMRVWLVRIAWNLAIDRRRKTRPEQIDERFAAKLVGKALPADEALAETRRVRLVLAEIDRLPEAERKVLLLTAVEEMETAEVAAVLGKSESGTRALLFRARERLKKQVARRERA